MKSMEDQLLSPQCFESTPLTLQNFFDWTSRFIKPFKLFAEKIMVCNVKCLFEVEEHLDSQAYHDPKHCTSRRNF